MKYITFKDYLFLGILGIAMFALLVVPLFSRHNDPEVIVYIPSGATLPKPATDAKVITGDKAVLWYTVYHETLEKGDNSDWARDAADDAVDHVYGTK